MKEEDKDLMWTLIAFFLAMVLVAGVISYAPGIEEMLAVDGR